MKSMNITAEQVKLIHTLKGALKLTNELYRDVLYERYRVNSSKELSQLQAGGLIDDLTERAKAAGAWENRTEGAGRGARAKAYEELGTRAGMATAAQLRKIQAQWSEVSRAEDAESRKKALRAFVLKVAKVSDLRFMDKDGAGAVIRALTAMQERQDETRKAV